mgnify:CR=1 FL=1
MLARLEAKGLASHKTVDQAYVYKSVPRPATVRDSALRQVVRERYRPRASGVRAWQGLRRTLALADHYDFTANPLAGRAYDLALMTEKDAVKVRANATLAADGQQALQLLG